MLYLRTTYMCPDKECCKMVFFDASNDEIFTTCPKCGKEMVDLGTELVSKEREEARQRQWERMRNNPIKCPTCSSKDVKRISTGAKVAGAMAFGVLSKTARSQFSCNNCGYKW